MQNTLFPGFSSIIAQNYYKRHQYELEMSFAYSSSKLTFKTSVENLKEIRWMIVKDQ